ncbi:hypothetical protein AB0F45_34690 [Streptomyces achromogenes]|uniref:hypothetical protein n=1 Tax=Streptomyces achromogenes TaxID=67255 RepID=UPI001FD7D493|nr:hypothetical protein [Streptomyces achromogenes]
MNLGMRRTAMASGTALLLCLGTVGTAIADGELPAPAADASERPVSTDDIAAQDEIDINDRTGWENGEVTSVVTPQYCDGPQTWIEITSKKNYHVPSWWNGTSYKDGPGGSMTVSVTKAGTVGMEISAGAEAEADAVLAKVKASVSVKVVGSVTITTGHTYSHTISSRKYGHLQYGSWGYKVSWKKWRRRGSGCGSPTLVTSGTATLPTKETGWKYWETSS